jgi:hypothetical protein
MTQPSYRIYYESRELARSLGDPLLGIVEAGSAEEAVRKAGRDPAIAQRAMPCCGLWAVRVEDEEQNRGQEPRSQRRS